MTMSVPKLFQNISSINSSISIQLRPDILVAQIFAFIAMNMNLRIPDMLDFYELLNFYTYIPEYIL